MTNNHCDPTADANKDWSKHSLYQMGHHHASAGRPLLSLNYWKLSVQWRRVFLAGWLAWHEKQRALLHAADDMMAQCAEPQEEKPALPSAEQLKAHNDYQHAVIVKQQKELDEFKSQCTIIRYAYEHVVTRLNEALGSKLPKDE